MILQHLLKEDEYIELLFSKQNKKCFNNLDNNLNSFIFFYESYFLS